MLHKELNVGLEARQSRAVGRVRRLLAAFKQQRQQRKQRVPNNNNKTHLKTRTVGRGQHGTVFI